MICPYGEGVSFDHGAEVANRSEDPQELAVKRGPLDMLVVELSAVKRKGFPPLGTELFEDGTERELRRVGREGQRGVWTWVME